MHPLDPDFDPDDAAAHPGLFGLPHTPEQAAVVVIPVPFDATASFHKGTASAPEAIRQASHQVDLFDLETGDPWRAGIALAPVDPRLAAWNQEATEAASVGDRVAVNSRGEAVNAVVRAQAEDILARDAIPAVLGGDHSVPFGAIAAALAHWPDMGLLHIDAHADLRDSYEGFAWSHASILHNVWSHLAPNRVVSVGLRDLGAGEHAALQANPNHHAWFDPEIAMDLARGRTWMDLVEAILEPLPKRVWVTVDIDGLDPAWCPGTGTPVPGGLSFRDTLVLLRGLASTRQIVGFDLCETGPTAYDANVAARLLYKLGGWAIHTKETNR